MANYLFPTSDKYQNEVAAWVNFVSQPFSLDHRNRDPWKGSSKVSTKGKNYHSITLPLQGYNSPIIADFEDVEPNMIANQILGASEAADTGAINGIGGNQARLATSGAAAVAGAVGLSPVRTAGAATRTGVQEMQFSDLMFKKMVKRVHTFKFSLFPKNKNDAQQIDNLCADFQLSANPIVVSAKSGVIRPPAMWFIGIYPNGGPENSQVLKNDILPTFLTYWNVNRLDVQAPVLTNDNYFAGLSIECTFTEIEPAYYSQSRSVLLNRSSFTYYGDQLL